VQVLDKRHASFLRNLGVQTPVIEVVNGFAPGDVPDESALRFRDPSDQSPISFLFLGRIDRINKGLDLLMRAFAQLKDAVELRLTLQGPDRGDRPALEDQVRRLNLSDRVTILGPDYDARPSDLAARHDLFVLPSRFEGFGLSALEAMLAARPVLVTDIAGLAPHVRAADAGVVADASVDSIRDGLKTLLSRRAEWKEIGLRGRGYVLENLNWTHIAADALAAYQPLASRTPLPGQYLNRQPAAG
jgi:glycosyltransferase involved in cell wall biosynthesis